MAEPEEWEAVELRRDATGDTAIPADPYDPRRWGIEDVDWDAAEEPE